MNAEDARNLAALGRLDPAPSKHDSAAPSLTPQQSQRAAAVLERILEADPHTVRPPSYPVRSTGRRPASRRWVLAPAAVLVGVAAIVVPAVTDRGEKAYATWSAVPVALTPAEGAAAARACLVAVDRAAQPQVAPLLAERRGGWTYVLVRPTEDTQASCIMPTDEIGDSPAAGRGRWFSSYDEETPDPAEDADEVRVDSAAVGTTKEGLFSYSEGAVGRDVVDITFTTPRGVTVEASVGNGRYAAWWPAGRQELRSPEISEAADIDVTLADGTSYRLPR